MIAPIDTGTLATLMAVPIDFTGVEFALGIVFSVPIALVLGLLTSIIAWAGSQRSSFLRSIGVGAGIGTAAGLVGATVSWVTWDAWESPARANDYANVSIVYWTIIGLLNIGEVAAIIYVIRRKFKAGQPDAPA